MGGVNIWEKLIEDTGNSSKVCSHCKNLSSALHLSEGLFSFSAGSRIIVAYVLLSEDGGQSPFRVCSSMMESLANINSKLSLYQSGYPS